MKPTDELKEGYCLTVRFLKSLQDKDGDEIYLPKDYTKKLSEFEQKQALLSLQNNGYISYDVKYKSKKPGTSYVLRTARPQIAGWNISIHKDFDNTYKECRSLLESENVEGKRLKKKGGEFHYDNKKLNFESKDSKHYHLIDILYGAKGNEKKLSYQEIAEEMRKRGIDVDTEKEEKVINNAKTNGLFHRVGLPKHAIKTERGQGLRLIN